MYREIMNDLIRWKDSTRRKPLLLTGVRQCGKECRAVREYIDNKLKK